ncbi:copper-transporting ATPase [Purpureocillium lavendulum]|uniref:Copper-transporting ATPase n=1 Tax=Purpureocillium lavendulum TaxID=1247861 RepID=A0AB34FV02_9HYPO|nr:copper-transporting ATPase [Purpureocillium lavendulum]
MTCTGCETKLNRTLATVAGVENLKTSLVLSRAEFDVDLSLLTVESVVKHLERTTEFTCERVSNQGAVIEFIVDGNADALVEQTWPAGVTDISVIGKGAIRVSLDPKLCGGRDLMERDWGMPIRLAPVRGDPGLEAGSKHVRHVGYMTLLSAVLTVPVLVLAWAPLPDRELAYSSASLALATIVQVVIAGPFYPKALKALVFSRVIEMDLLIVLSTSAAYIFSVISFAYLVAGRPLSTGQFFETSTLLVTLIMVGRFMAALARQKAVESISIRSLQATTAILVEQSDTEEHEIDTRLLQYGDVFKVLPDSRIPTDGTVISGSSEVDESMLTGESLPVEKYPKSPVIAGTVNGSGTLVVRLTRLPGDNTITTISSMVDEAKLSKPKLQELADIVASYFVPVVVALTIITFVIWVAVGKTVRGKSGSEATVDAITYAITVLIVSCPCAIGLAVPMVVVIASGVAAERGVIFKSASAIEVAHQASHVVFDKTGTLTEGKLKVVSEEVLTEDTTYLSLLLGLISDSRHPVSVAVADHLRSKGIKVTAVSDVKSLTGKGLEAQAGGRTFRAGNSRWLNLATEGPVQSVLGNRFTAFCFTVDGTLGAVYGLEDSLRHGTESVISDLQARGISVHIVSGDDHGPVEAVATKLHVPSSSTLARSSPGDKQAYIGRLLKTGQSGTKEPVVIFCGDGTNDAVALAQATIGVHMNEGSDMAKSAADVVLMRPDLSGIAVIMDTSRRSVNRIRFNFAWSFVYNTVAVLLASGAVVKARISPQFAGLGELVSVLPVILAAVLLRWPRR